MAEMIRVGYISSVNYAEGTAQVVYKDRDNAVSPFLPLWSNEYNPPEKDTLVYVLHLPNGGTRGMILVPPYTEGNRPVEGKKGIWRKDFGDGSYMKYDYESKKLEIVADILEVSELSVSGNITTQGNVKASGSLSCGSITAKSITTSGNVHIKGNLTVDGSYPT